MQYIEQQINSACCVCEFYYRRQRRRFYAIVSAGSWTDFTKFSGTIDFRPRT